MLSVSASNDNYIRVKNGRHSLHRQWFAEGELRSPAVMQHGPSARVLRKRGGTSERIQQCKVTGGSWRY